MVGSSWSQSDPFLEKRNQKTPVLDGHITVVMAELVPPCAALHKRPVLSQSLNQGIKAGLITLANGSQEIIASFMEVTSLGTVKLGSNGDICCL